MAYVVWRVLLKKYNKVRLGLLTNQQQHQLPQPPVHYQVTPSEKSHSHSRDHSSEATNAEDGAGTAWADESDRDEANCEFSRKTLSKSKRVKSYIQKKCKHVEVKVRSRSKSGSRSNASTSWYINQETPEEVQDDSRTEGGTAVKVSKEPDKSDDVEESKNLTGNKDLDNKEDDSDTASEGTLLDETQSEVLPLPLQGKWDVGCLVDKYFGQVYPHYVSVRAPLVREARDLLVTKFFGDTERFEMEFCVPAADVARSLAVTAHKQNCGSYPEGWPLSVRGDLCLHLYTPDPGCLLPRDVHLSLHLPEGSTEEERAEYKAVSRSGRVLLRGLPTPSLLMAHEQTDASDLPGLLRLLVVSAERCFARVPLSELAYPRSESPVQYGTPERKDSSNQTPPMFEMDSSIPHIDSDEEHETSLKPKDYMTFVPALKLSDIPDTHLLSGIYLPGCHDSQERAVIVVESEQVERYRMTPSDVAKLLHYLCQIPRKCERTRNGVCILVVSESYLENLDYALVLLSKVKISSMIVFSISERREEKKLPRSGIKYTVVNSKSSLEEFLPADQIPTTCGGDVSHDHIEWCEFFREYEDLKEKCTENGRRMVQVMADLPSTGELTRMQAVQEARNLARAVTDPDLNRLRTRGPAVLEALRQRALWLPASEDVRSGLEALESLYNEVIGTADKIEELSEKRRAKLKDIARIKALESETEQVLSWLSHKGDDWLKKHNDLATTLPGLKQQEQDFEKFYFISMRHLEKGSDLLEEAVQCSSPGSHGLRDLARTLKNHLRGFSDRLEDTRERLEDTSRCFCLLDRAYEWALEAMKYMSRIKPTEDMQNPETSLKQLRLYLMAHPAPTEDHFTEMIALATKLDNDKLLQQCKLAQCRCQETVEQIRDLLDSEEDSFTNRWPGSPRRRSLPCGRSAEWSSHVCHVPGHQQNQRLGHIPEEGRIVGRAGIQRSNTWQYSADGFDDEEEDEDKLSADNRTEGSDQGNKSCDDIEDSEACCNKNISPIPVNSHLHSDLSVDVDGQCGAQTLKTKKTMLLIMKEMIQTERDYVRSLEYVIENYIPELVREDIPQALRGQRNVIFGNVEKIYEFHSQHFLQELEKCEHSPAQVGQCFLRHEKKFYLYALYNKNKPKSDALMSEYGTQFFKAKQMELGDKMDLASYLLKPVQRMGKYALLLQQLMKASRQEAAELKEAETMVRFQLRHGNDLLAMDSLKDCDVNVKEQGRLLRQNEFLVWQGKGSKKYYRHVFLFEELILFSKARRFPDHKNLDIYIYKHSIKTSDIGLTAKVGDSNTKFEIWFRKRKPNDTFTLQSISEEIKQAWTEELSNLLWKQALRNREMRMAEMNSMGIGNKPCLDIRPSANQISDRSISIAQLSKTAPRFRNSIAVSPQEQNQRTGRPHSIISVTSSSDAGSSSSSSASISSSTASSREGVEGTRQMSSSQCSSAESGIVSDWNTSSSVTSNESSPPHRVSGHLSVKL
ncbi:puratrophin-1-like isoform X3 [Cimex lectularius]|uniref:Puratrophin-1 n=1 Tax=Cimex lectularius TaxID=79782 RepID=A0A8I6S5H5_CIMLE|nr:puratrophin-1-like isoform X3 [Cimex lectularius]